MISTSRTSDFQISGSAISSHKNIHLKMFYDIKPTDRIFQSLSKHVLATEMERGCKVTGLKKIRIHDLRHSHASLLVELGFQSLAIAERLGHEKIETTLNTYSHLYPNKQAELADRLELENEEDEL